MKLQRALSALFLACVLGAGTSAKAEGDKDVPAPEWQKQSLSGITSIKYRVGFDQSNSLGDIPMKSFAEAHVPMKEAAKEDDPKESLKDNEARVKVVVQFREKKKSWVGLSVDQQCKLTRTASIKWDGETYKAGKVCDRTKEADAAKVLCDDFVQALNTANPKKK